MSSHAGSVHDDDERDAETAMIAPDKPAVRRVSFLRRHGLKILLAAVIVGVLIYIVVDQVQRGCDGAERDQNRIVRLRKAGLPLNRTVTVPGTNMTRNETNCGDAPYTLNLQDGRCHFPSACVSVALEAFVDWVADNTVLGAFLYTLIYTVCAVFWVPGSLLTLGAGAAFSAATDLGLGILIGTISVWFGAFFGACCAYLLGHFVFHDLVQSLIRKWRITKAIDAAIKEHGLKTMLLLRLSPVIPYNAFNYVMAGTSVKFKDYALGCIAMLPGTVAYVYIGASIQEAARSGGDGDTVRTVVLIVGLIVTFIAVVLISYFAKKQLDKQLASEKAAEAEAEATAEEAKAGAGGGAERGEDEGGIEALRTV